MQIRETKSLISVSYTHLDVYKRQGWNEYILPLVFTMTDASKRPLTVGVTMLKNAGDGAAAWNIMFAGATIAIVPILVIYIFASKYFINGMTAGAVKG